MTFIPHTVICMRQQFYVQYKLQLPCMQRNVMRISLGRLARDLKPYILHGRQCIPL